MIMKQISSNVAGDSNDENNFPPHKFLLTNTQVLKLDKAFRNDCSVKIKISKTKLHKIRLLGGFLGRILETLLKTELPLIGSVLKLLAKRVLIPLGLIVGASATDAVIHKKYLISNEEVNDIMKIIKSLEESCLLIKGVGETIEATQSK